MNENRTKKRGSEPNIPSKWKLEFLSRGLFGWWEAEGQKRHIFSKFLAPKSDT